MKRALRRGAIGLALGGLAAAPGQALTDPAAPATAVIGTPTVQAAHGLAAELRAGGLTVTEIPRIGAVEVSGDGLRAVRAAVADDPRADWVEPPRDRTLFALAPGAIDAVTGRQYDWAADAVQSGEVLLGVTAFPVRVAVVDSGVDRGHPDLAGRLGPGYDVVQGGTDVRDAVGHGTFVAGLISAIDGNGLGGRGIAGATTVIPVRITTTGSISSTSSATGIIRAVDSGATVLNLSYGGDTISAVEKEALAYAAQKDVLVVAAAGNSYQRVTDDGTRNPLQYPAAAVGGLKGAWSGGLSVAATDPLGRHAVFSTSNDYVSVAAPGAGLRCGDGVFSTIPGGQASLWDSSPAGSCTRVVGDLSSSTGRYGYAEGTSFAAPLVSGAAALARDVNPRLTAEQTADVIRRSADQTLGTGWNPMTGAGVLDVAAAVALARVYDTLPPAPALAATPGTGVISVSLGGTDAAGQGTLPAGMATYRLDRSSDGNTYTATGPPQSTPVHVDDLVPAGERRWYRGTLCDLNHNCTTALSGPVTSAIQGAPLPGVTRGARPTLTKVATVRPRTCTTCVQISFVASGPGKLTWSVSASGQKGRILPRLVPADGHVTTRVRLLARPRCGQRITVAIEVTSPFGTTRASRSIPITGSCTRRTHR